MPTLITSSVACYLRQKINFKRKLKMVSLNKIIQAKITIGHFVNKTPFALSAKLSKILGANVYLKEENLQRTGAYKIRGAYNKKS